MTINWAAIKDDVATVIASNMASVIAGDFASLPVSSVALAAVYTWNGSNTVLASDTSEVSASPSSYIRLDSDGKWYKVIAIDPDVSVTVQDVFSVGSYPSGSTPSSKSLSPLPAAPTSLTFKTKLGTPIANAVFDGVKSALDQAQINDVASDPGNTVGPGVIV